MQSEPGAFAFSRARGRASDIDIDSGRRDGISDRDDRICECCHLQRVEDEHHFVFDCPLNAAARLEFTDAVDEITRQSDPFGWRSRSWSATRSMGVSAYFWQAYQRA